MPETLSPTECLKLYSLMFEVKLSLIKNISKSEQLFFLLWAKIAHFKLRGRELLVPFIS